MQIPIIPHNATSPRTVETRRLSSSLCFSKNGAEVRKLFALDLSILVVEEETTKDISASI